MNIQKVIEKDNEKIFGETCPASAACVLLCDDYGYNYFYARREFFKYCNENNKLAVYRNF